MQTDSFAGMFDQHADQWARQGPLILSDFTARPMVLQELAPVTGQHVLDLGCGEGYVSRLVAQAGAQSVFGIDISGEMIERAQQAARDAPCAMTFMSGNATHFQDFPRKQFDRVLAVFMLSYVSCAEMTAIFRVRAFAPCSRAAVSFSRFRTTFLPYIRPLQPPVYFDSKGRDYFAGVDQPYEGYIWRRDGKAVPVSYMHKTFADYFNALDAAGFQTLPKIMGTQGHRGALGPGPRFF